MKKFRVRITMAVATAEETVYHEYTLEGQDEHSVFRSIARHEWFIGERIVRYAGQEHPDKVYKDYIQTKYIADICIWEEE